MTCLWNTGGQKAAEWHIQSIERKISQPIILYPTELFFMNEGNFPEEKEYLYPNISKKSHRIET